MDGQEKGSMLTNIVSSFQRTQKDLERAGNSTTEKDLNCIEQATFKENIIKMMDYIDMEMGESGLLSKGALQVRGIEFCYFDWKKKWTVETHWLVGKLEGER